MTSAQRDDLLIHIDKQVDKINIQLDGNGNKGVFDRLDEMEDWQDSHPKECPMIEKRKNIIAVRAIEVAVMGIIIGAVMEIIRIVL